MGTPALAPLDPPPVLSLDKVSVTFGGVKALQDVSFEVLPGEIHCIAGENGSGKSTLIKIITGIYQPAPGGRFRVAGESVTVMTPALARSAGLVVIWQDLALFNEMTVAENIAIEAVLGGMPRAVDLARDTNRLKRMRQGMRERMAASPLMNGSTYARSFEIELRTIWRKFVR